MKFVLFSLFLIKSLALQNLIKPDSIRQDAVEQIPDIQIEFIETTMKPEDLLILESSPVNAQPTEMEDIFIDLPFPNFSNFFGPPSPSKNNQLSDQMMSPFMFSPVSLFETFLNLIPDMENAIDVQNGGSGFVEIETYIGPDGQSQTTVTKNLRKNGQPPVVTKEVFSTDLSNNNNQMDLSPGFKIEEIKQIKPDEQTDQSIILEPIVIKETPILPPDDTDVDKIMDKYKNASTQEKNIEDSRVQDDKIQDIKDIDDRIIDISDQENQNKQTEQVEIKSVTQNVQEKKIQNIRNILKGAGVVGILSLLVVVYKFYPKNNQKKNQ